MRIAPVSLLVVVFLSAAGFPATIYVPDHYPAIQDAINASSAGDTVLVRPGTYVENIDFNGRAITVRSEKGPAVTTIDGNGSGSVVTFRSGEDGRSVLEGFTITNGGATDGGGVACWWGSSPTIAGNTIIDNGAHFGGGIGCCYSSSPRISGNRISANVGILEGGGIYCLGSSPCVEQNTIFQNTAGEGGGIHLVDSFAAITRNTISGNGADRTTGRGGGISCNSSRPVITENTIMFNMAWGTEPAGGGIFCGGCDANFTNNLIAWNSTSSLIGNGGGIYCLTSVVTMTGDTITENECRSSSEGGGGICCTDGSTLTIANAVLWNNTWHSAKAKEIWIGDALNPSTVSISYSDLEGGRTSCHIDSGCTLAWGGGMIDGDPLFVGDPDHDFHIAWNSPCRNSGDNSAVAAGADFEGDPRVAQGVVDMGADEYYPHLYHGGEVGPGKTVVFKAVGIPGAGSTLCHGPGLRNPPLRTPYGDLHLQWPLTFHNNGTFPASGYTEKAYTLPTGLCSGQRLHYQLFTGGRLWNPMTLVAE